MKDLRNIWNLHWKSMKFNESIFFGKQIYWAWKIAHDIVWKKTELISLTLSTSLAQKTCYLLWNGFLIG